MTFEGTTKRAKENIALIKGATKDKKTTGGIYMIIHPKSRHRYVGQTENLQRRRREHWAGLKNEINNKGNEMKRLYNTMNKQTDSGMWMFLVLRYDDREYAHR